MGGTLGVLQFIQQRSCFISQSSHSRWTSSFVQQISTANSIATGNEYAIITSFCVFDFLLRNHCVKADVLRSSAKPPKIRKCPKQKEPCLKKSGTTLGENVQPFWLNPILNILIVTRGIIHVYTSAMRMLCRCDASAAKKLSGQCIRRNLDSLVCRHYNAKESKEKES